MVKRTWESLERPLAVLGLLTASAILATAGAMTWFELEERVFRREWAKITRPDLSRPRAL